jgi:hypothetical protein
MSAPQNVIAAVANTSQPTPAKVKTPKTKSTEEGTNPRKVSPNWATRRHAALLELYNRHYSDFITVAGESPYITAMDIEAIVACLVNQFDSYHGPATGKKDEPAKHAAAAFLRWGTRAVRDARDMLPLSRELAEAILPLWLANERSARAGLREVLDTCLDLPEHDTEADLIGDVRLWTFCNAASLLDPNQRATPATRLWIEGYWAGRAEKTTRLRNRDRFIGESNDGVEVVSARKRGRVDPELVGLSETGEYIVEPDLYADVPSRHTPAYLRAA